MAIGILHNVTVALILLDSRHLPRRPAALRSEAPIGPPSSHASVNLAPTSSRWGLFLALPKAARSAPIAASELPLEDRGAKDGHSRG